MVVEMREEWRDVVGYEGKYQVSNLGNVRSVDRIVIDTGKGGTIRNRTIKGKLLKQQLNRQGYYTVVLYPIVKGHRETLVSRMVAKAFIPNPDNLPCVNHRDENPKNNSVDNLEWCTKEYNNQYGTIRERHRQIMLGTKRPHSEETKAKISKSITEWHKSRRLIMSIESSQVFKCSICGETFTGWGNNPWPVTKGENDRCCDTCNSIHVIPARLAESFKAGK